MERVTKLFESVKMPRLEKEHAVPAVISIVAATTILYSSYRFVSDSNRKKKQGTREIPSPGSSYPYVGHMLSLGELPGRKVAEWHKELGPILKLKMGSKTWIMLDDPVLAQKIFVSRGADTSERPYSNYTQNIYGMNGKGFAFANGHQWKKARSASLSVLAPKQIENLYMESITQESQDLVDRLIASTEKEGGTDPFKYLELNSMNVVFGLGFGRKFNSVDDPEFQELSELVETSMKYAGMDSDLASFLPIVSIFDFFNGTVSKMKNFVTNERDPIFRRLVQEAIEKEGPNLVKSLDDGHDMSEDEKIVFMSDLIGGGTDTISTTLSWCIAIMCHHPHVQKKASAEIDDFVARRGHLPTFKDRNEVPYCVSVIKECMRYRPTGIFGVPHSTAEDIEVDGYILPKNCTILSSTESMHQRPDVYPQPEQFIPERFMDNIRTMQSAANGKLADRDHYNFGWGRRICPGIHLADVEIFLAFIQIFSRCFVEPTTKFGLPDIEGAINAGLTITPFPYKVKFSRRVNELTAQ